MRSRLALVGVLALVVVVLIWNFAFFAPAGRDVDHAKQRRDAATQLNQDLSSKLHDLRQVSDRAPEQKAKLDQLNAQVPTTPDLEGFIRSAYELKVQAGVDWVSIQSAEPVGASGASEIKLTVVVSGGFFQVLDYLNRVEALRRLVVVDGINITTGSDTTGSGSGSTGSGSAGSGASSSGAPRLTVTLNARMFTQAAAPTSSTGTGSGAGSGSSGAGTTTTTTGATNTAPTTTGVAN